MSARFCRNSGETTIALAEQGNLRRLELRDDGESFAAQPAHQCAVENRCVYPTGFECLPDQNRIADC